MADQRGGWRHALSAINQRYGFLDRIRAARSDLPGSSKLPTVLSVSMALAANMSTERPTASRLAVVFPRAFDTAFWTAIGAAFAAMQAGFISALEKLPPFARGQKLLLDSRWVVVYERQEVLRGRRRIWVRMKGHRGAHAARTFPFQERLRFQPADTRRPLTPVQRRILSPPVHLLDEVLGIAAYGNRTLFSNSVVLVSSVGRARTLCGGTCIACPDENGGAASAPLLDVLQWGQLTREGELEQWGYEQVEADPVVAVAPDLLYVREYLRTNGSVEGPIVILDGSTSYLRDLGSLDAVLDAGWPVLVVLDALDAGGVKELSERSFQFWTWTAEELSALGHRHPPGSEPRYDSVFGQFRRALSNHAQERIEACLCEDAVLQDSAELLQRLHHELRERNVELGKLEHCLYSCLLFLARLLRPIGFAAIDDSAALMASQLRDARAEITRNSMWLGDTAGSARQIVENIHGRLGEDAGNGCPSKATALGQLLAEAAGGNSSVAVVLSTPREVALTATYWSAWLNEKSKIEFHCPRSLEARRAYDEIVVCGWLRLRTMREILHLKLAPKITLLLYPFEKRWLESAERHWRREAPRDCGANQKARLLGIETFPEPAAQQPQTAREGEPPGEEFDVAGFELAIRPYKHFVSCGSLEPGEESVLARPVEFTDGRYAFLTETHRVRVVTDFITGRSGADDEVPRRTVTALRPGDFVIFREGSQHDVIREVADAGLRRAGQDHLRVLSALWKKALREFVDKHPGGPDKAIAELRSRGLQKSEATVWSWLRDEDRIGPQRDRDLTAIAEITGDAELQRKSRQVRRAIKVVRGAHLQAGRFLYKHVLSTLPQHLTEAASRGGSFTLEHEDVGQVHVVEVVEVADEPREIPVSDANRLLGDEVLWLA